MSENKYRNPFGLLTKLLITGMLLILAVILYSHLYVTPRKKITIIDAKTKKPITGVAVLYQQPYIFIWGHIFSDHYKCITYSQAGMTDSRGEVIFSNRPFYQGWGCRPISTPQYFIFKPGYYYPGIPHPSLDSTNENPERLFELHVYDDKYNLCLEWEKYLKPFFDYCSDSNNATCKKIIDELRIKQQEKLRGSSCNQIDGLIKAVQKGDQKKVAALLDAYPQIINYRTDREGPPLVEAVVYDHLDLVRYLLDRGADIEAADWRGNAPLLYAVINSRWEIAKLLIERGANVNIRDPEYDKTLLMISASEGNINMVEFLLTNGANINEVSGGRTSLYWAVLSSQPEMVEYLLTKGADPNQGNPLYVAVNQPKDNLEIVKSLVNHGADINQQLSIHETPLHEAARRGHVDTVLYLIENGADVNSQNRFNHTPLDEAEKSLSYRVKNYPNDNPYTINTRKTIGILKKYGGMSCVELMNGCKDY